MDDLLNDFLAETIFQIAFEAGLRGSTEPRGIFSQATPMEVLAAQLEAEAGSSNGLYIVRIARQRGGGGDF